LCGLEQIVLFAWFVKTIELRAIGETVFINVRVNDRPFAGFADRSIMTRRGREV